MQSQSVEPTPSDGPTGRIRFVTLCQQLLVLAVVATVLTPAARTISLDIRPSQPGTAAESTAGLQAVGEEVPLDAVDPVVEEIRITAKEKKRRVQERVAGLRANLTRTARGDRVRSEPLEAAGFTTVGITWDPAERLANDDVEFRVRTRVGNTWSEWTSIPYHAEHAPDPDSPEAVGIRPGTEAIVVGEVDDVQVQVDSEGAAPADLKVAVINPGEAERTARQEPAIDTADDTGVDAAKLQLPLIGTEPDLELTAAAGPVTPRPRIFSRAQWGADEELRSQSPPSYYEVHSGFVHHTVTGNDYSRTDVPRIIRGIYAYHTQNLGWRDIGYNFLIDRFGRIWEGRWGGAARPVVGAHTSGYNAHTFAGSAIGNFEITRPSNAMVDAFAELFAWKLSLHGVGPKKKKALTLNGRTFPAINGHRDAGATACPGQHLYARLGDIRNLAAQYRANWSGRDLMHNLTGGWSADLVMRRRSDGRGFVLPVAQTRSGKYVTRSLIDTGLDLSTARDVLKVGDWTGDGHGDLIVRHRKDGRLFLHRGNSTGRFGEGIVIARGMRRVSNLAAVGDFNGNGRPDLIGQPRKYDRAVMLYPGRGLNGVASPQRMAGPVQSGLSPVPVGRWDRDGAPDVLYRSRDEIYAYYGNGPGGYLGRRQLGLDISIYNTFTGVGNVGEGAHGDVVARQRGTNELFVLFGSYRNQGSFKSRVSLGRTLEGFNMIS